METNPNRGTSNHGDTNQDTVSQEGMASFDELGHSAIEPSPPKEGETPQEYGDRSFDEWSMSAISEFIKRNPQESQEDYEKRIKEFYAAHPREKGQEGVSKRETIAEYKDRIANLVKKDDGSDKEGGGNKDDPEPTPKPNPGDVLQISGPTKIEIGEIDIKRPEIEFAEDRSEHLKEVKERLDKLLPTMSELYARNRRLIVGPKNRANFMAVKEEYGKVLDEYLRLKSGESLEKVKHELSDHLGSRFEELKKDIEQRLAEFSRSDIGGPYKTQEEVDKEKARLTKEASETLEAEYAHWIKAIETGVNTTFVEDFIAEETKLESATIKALDKGTICRKFVNKVLNSKVLKGTLVAAGVAGLAVTGVGLGMGLAAGTMAVGVSYTAGGVVMGAAKGFLSGTLMSRQNSKNSAVRGFASEAEIRQQLEGIDVTKEGPGVANAASWLLGQYTEANKTDASSNRKRTAVAAGLGAAMGGLMSGIRIDNITTRTTSSRQITGYEPRTYEAANLENVNVSNNHGLYQVFEQLGGDPANKEQAVKIAESVFSKYGAKSDLVEGIVAPSGNAVNIYPGKISEWPAVAQSCIKEVANELASKGLIPGNAIGGGPIFSTVEKTVVSFIPDAFRTYLAKATATIGAGAIGGIIGGAGKANKNPNKAKDTTSLDEIIRLIKELPPEMRKELATSLQDNQTGADQTPPANQSGEGAGTSSTTTQEADGSEGATGESSNPPVESNTAAEGETTTEGETGTSSEGETATEGETSSGEGFTLDPETIAYLGNNETFDDGKRSALDAWWNRQSVDNKKGIVDQLNNMPKDQAQLLRGYLAAIGQL